jgi:hypothetical protein
MAAIAACVSLLWCFAISLSIPSLFPPDWDWDLVMGVSVIAFEITILALTTALLSRFAITGRLFRNRNKSVTT